VIKKELLAFFELHYLASQPIPTTWQAKGQDLYADNRSQGAKEKL